MAVAISSMSLVGIRGRSWCEWGWQFIASNWTALFSPGDFVGESDRSTKDTLLTIDILEQICIIDCHIISSCICDDFSDSTSCRILIWVNLAVLALFCKWVELVTNLITSDSISNFTILIDGNSEGLSLSSRCCSNKVGADDSGLMRILGNLNGTSAGSTTSKLTNGKDEMVGVGLVLDLRGRVLRIWTVPACLVSRIGTRAPGITSLMCMGAVVLLSWRMGVLLGSLVSRRMAVLLGGLVSWRMGLLLSSLVRGGVMSCRLGSMIVVCWLGSWLRVMLLRILLSWLLVRVMLRGSRLLVRAASLRSLMAVRISCMVAMLTTMGRLAITFGALVVGEFVLSWCNSS